MDVSTKSLRLFSFGPHCVINRNEAIERTVNHQIIGAQVKLRIAFSSLGRCHHLRWQIEFLIDANDVQQRWVIFRAEFDAADKVNQFLATVSLKLCPQPVSRRHQAGINVVVISTASTAILGSGPTSLLKQLELLQ